MTMAEAIAAKPSAPRGAALIDSTFVSIRTIDRFPGGAGHVIARSAPAWRRLGRRRRAEPCPAAAINVAAAGPGSRRRPRANASGTSINRVR